MYKKANVILFTHANVKKTLSSKVGYLSKIYFSIIAMTAQKRPKTVENQAQEVSVRYSVLLSALAATAIIII